MGKRKAKKRKAEYARTVLFIDSEEERAVPMMRADIKRMATAHPFGWLIGGRYHIDMKAEFPKKVQEMIKKGKYEVRGSLPHPDWAFFRSVDSLDEVEPAISTGIEARKSTLLPGEEVWMVMKFRVVDSKTGRVLKVTKPIEVRA